MTHRFLMLCQVSGQAADRGKEKLRGVRSQVAARVGLAKVGAKQGQQTGSHQ